MSNIIASNWMILTGFAVAVMLLTVIQWLTGRRYQMKIDELNQEIEVLKGTLNVLCTSAVGVDRRVGKLEQGKRELQQRQETIEQNNKPDQPYAEAIRVVQQGATANQLVEEFGISRNEANLIVMLHGVKKVS